MIRVERLTWESDLSAAYSIRFAVFVDEQRVPADEEIDARDTLTGTYHTIVWDGAKAVATGRVYRDESGYVHIGRVAVSKTARGTGVGRVLMDDLAQVALEKFGDDPGVTIELSAQVHAIGFYEKLGYVVVNHEIYLDAGIEHKDMCLKISRV
ncbi:GNAT family N-acetyltransferase [Arcanobacterium haemolyticum]